MRRMVRRLGSLRFRARPMAGVFTYIYRHRSWGDSESASGPGSDLRATESIRAHLPGLVNQFRIRSILDAACGDFFWMSRLELPIERYLGVDIVADLIQANRERYADDVHQFKVLDLTRDPLPAVDLILCRDCLVHLSFRRILAALENFRRSGSTYLLSTTFPGVRENRDLLTGGWRPINLLEPPMSLPEPLLVIPERHGHDGRVAGDHADKALALWRLEPSETT